MYIVWTYFAYVVISLAVTIWVARTLHKNGRIFLIDAFHSNIELADSVNHLLLVGFYLVNIGYVTLALRTSVNLANLRESIVERQDRYGALGFGRHAFFQSLYLLQDEKARARACRATVVSSRHVRRPGSSGIICGDCSYSTTRIAGSAGSLWLGSGPSRS
jgi:hypothetical protein